MKYIREQAGITQRQLALYLDESRSTLSRYELGIRRLALASKQKIARLTQILYEGNFTRRSEKSAQEIKNLFILEKNKLLRYRNTFKMRGLRLEKKLKKVKENYHSSLTMLHIAECLLSELPPEEDNRDRNIIKHIENSALRKINANNRAVQALMELEIEACSFFCIKLEEIAEKLEEI